MLSTILYHTEPSRLLVTTNSVSEDAYMSVYLPGLVLVRLSTASHRCLGMTATECNLFCFPEAVLGLESLCFPPGGGGGGDELWRNSRAIITFHYGEIRTATAGAANFGGPSFSWFSLIPVFLKLQSSLPHRQLRLLQKLCSLHTLKKGE